MDGKKITLWFTKNNDKVIHISDGWNIHTFELCKKNSFRKSFGYLIQTGKRFILPYEACAYQKVKNC